MTGRMLLKTTNLFVSKNGRSNNHHIHPNSYLFYIQFKHNLTLAYSINLGLNWESNHYYWNHKDMKRMAKL